MSLVSMSESSDLRIYKPIFGTGCPQPEEFSKFRAHVLRKIHSAYRKALKVPEISGGETPACSSLCLGLLDPFLRSVAEAQARDCEPSRVCEGGEEKEDLKGRSLDGMVAFLTRLFPDLSESQAVRYLFLADADAVVAARIVVSDIGMKRFYDSGPAIMEMALVKCAALAAGHSDPDRLVGAWRNISSRPYYVRRLLKRLRGKPQSHYSPVSTINKLSRMLNEGPPFDREEDVSWAWKLAGARRIPPRLLTRTLHDAIHSFYLQALARLPAGELHSRFHRSLLKAGYCYGPLDPVSNIIINTIWYDAAFPPTKTLDLDIIGMKSLHRMENRSVYGLASFLCTRYHCFSFGEAVHCLLQADANLALADHNLDTAASASFGITGCGPPLCSTAQPQGPPDTSVEEAFLAAAKAACHPNPDAQVKFLTSCKEMLGSAVSLLQGCNKLSSQDVQRLATLLCPKCPSCETGALLPLPLTGYRPRKGYRHAELADMQTRISKKVNALLNAYEQMPNGDPKFELHTICGVNDRVSCLSSDCPHGYHYSHVNFMATPKSPCGSGVPTLFFAEISSGYEDTSFCCPLPLPLPCAAQVRCLHCEFMGTRIVHPVGTDFHGGESKFEKVACRKNPDDDDFDMDIINHRFDLADNIYGRVKEDDLYDDLDGHKIEERDLGSMSIRRKILFLAKNL
ncbi:unnamed protein product [Alopecurus aequalis]